jgi:hypothetical protein
MRLLSRPLAWAAAFSIAAVFSTPGFAQDGAASAGKLSFG